MAFRKLFKSTVAIVSSTGLALH